MGQDVHDSRRGQIPLAPPSQERTDSSCTSCLVLSTEIYIHLGTSTPNAIGGTSACLLLTTKLDLTDDSLTSSRIKPKRTSRANY